jgi:hypothetical protein
LSIGMKIDPHRAALAMPVEAVGDLDTAALQDDVGEVAFENRPRV